MGLGMWAALAQTGLVGVALVAHGLLFFLAGRWMWRRTAWAASCSGAHWTSGCTC